MHPPTNKPSILLFLTTAVLFIPFVIPLLVILSLVQKLIDMCSRKK